MEWYWFTDWKILIRTQRRNCKTLLDPLGLQSILGGKKRFFLFAWWNVSVKCFNIYHKFWIGIWKSEYRSALSFIHRNFPKFYLELEDTAVIVIKNHNSSHMRSSKLKGWYHSTIHKWSHLGNIHTIFATGIRDTNVKMFIFLKDIVIFNGKFNLFWAKGKMKKKLHKYILTYLAIFDTEFHSKHIIDRKKNEGSPTIYIFNYVSVCLKNRTNKGIQCK